MNRHLLLLMAVVSVALVGCTANSRAINIQRKIGENESHVLSIDARQRVILAAKRGDGTRFCAEASPDVFSVVAQVLSGGLSVGKAAEARTLEAALQGAFSSAEQASTIPRTQTINMLRELMYRTCERYLSGAITEEELPIQAVRDQRLMVAILAIEQLTGAVVPKPVAIGASGSAAAGAGGEAVVRLDDARKAKLAAESGYQKAKQAYEAENNRDGEGACDAIAAATAAGGTLTDDQKQRQPKCVTLSADVAASQAQRTDATQHYESLLKASTLAGQSATTTVSADVAGGIARAHTESVESVSNTIRAIWSDLASDGSEVMLYCLRTMSNYQKLIGQPGEDAAKLRESLAGVADGCTKMLTAVIEREKQDQLAEAAISAERANAAVKRSAAIASDRFSLVWPTFSQRLSSSEQRKALIEKMRAELIGSDQGKADCFERAVPNGKPNEAAARACFVALPADMQRRIEKGEL